MQVEKYKIQFDFDLENKVYSGKEEIFLNLEKDSNNLKINSVDLKVNEIKLNDRKIKFNISGGDIIVKNKFKPGKYKIFIDFQGELKEVLGGIYLSKYRDKEETKYLITTQFEPIEARKAFPCFDDPDKKAVFDITLIFDKNLKAISNTLPKKEEISGNKKKIIFYPTPRMSTYLLYIGIGDWYFAQDKYKNVLLRVAVANKEKLKGTKFALENTKKFLSYLENYFAKPYPLKKLDLIAIPDFAAGAMENWGAITFRENLLLVFKNITSLAAQERIAEVIAHELTHMWFGNLVTMKWWDDLWLNESFATYLAYKAVNHFYPEWRVLEKYVFEEVHSALNADSLNSSHPIKVKVKDPNESTEIFDEISYEKGGSVLRMIENYLGEKDFQKGLRLYIKKFAYQNAKAEDLWQCLAEVSNKPVLKVMKDFVNKTGFPVIKVNKEKNGHKLSQKRFLLLEKGKEKDIWQIPMVISKDNQEERLILKATEKKLKISFEKTLILNNNFSGFYLTNYDEDILEKNLQNKEELSELNLYHLLNDYEFLVRKGEKNLAKFLEIIENYFAKTDKKLILSYLISILSFYDFLLENNQKVKEVLTKLSLRTLEILGKEPKKKESPFETSLRQKALISLGEFENKEILDFSADKFKEFLKDKNKIHPDIKQAVFINALIADDSFSENILNYFRETNLIEEQNKCLISLGYLRNFERLKGIFDFILSDEVRFNQIFFFLGYVVFNPKGKVFVFNWLKENWQKLEEKGGGAGKSDFVLIRILKSTIPYSGAFIDEKELKEFLNQKSLRRFEKTKNVVFEKAIINKNFIKLWKE
jgi:tricorn protease interacting factor F2/3